MPYLRNIGSTGRLVTSMARKVARPGIKKEGSHFGDPSLFHVLALLTQTESLNDGAVALNVSLLEVVEQSPALTYQLGQCPFSAIILTVLLKMFRQMGNTV